MESSILFGKTIAEERGFQTAGSALNNSTASKTHMKGSVHLKIDSHIVLFFFLLPTMALTPIYLNNFYVATKHETGTPVKPSWTWKHVYGHVKKAESNKNAFIFLKLNSNKS